MLVAQRHSEQLRVTFYAKSIVDIMKRSKVKYTVLTEDKDEPSQRTIELSTLPSQSDLLEGTSFSENYVPQAGEPLEQPLLRKTTTSNEYNELLEEKTLLQSISMYDAVMLQLTWINSNRIFVFEGVSVES